MPACAPPLKTVRYGAWPYDVDGPLPLPLPLLPLPLLAEPLPLLAEPLPLAARRSLEEKIEL
jgi:hypothetical protein